MSRSKFSIACVDLKNRNNMISMRRQPSSLCSFCFSSYECQSKVRLPVSSRDLESAFSQWVKKNSDGAILIYTYAIKSSAWWPSGLRHHIIAELLSQVAKVVLPCHCQNSLFIIFREFQLGHTNKMKKWLEPAFLILQIHLEYT